MVVTRKAVLIWLSCLVSLYCDVAGIVTKSATSAVGKQDQTNWNLLSKHTSKSIQRTGNTNLNTFSKILLANIRARSKVGRSDDGIFLFRGDIKIDAKDVSKVTASGNKGRKKRALMKDRTALWNSPIYYQLSSSLNKQAKNAIASAIKEMQRVLPCVKWIKGKVITRQQGYLYFFPGDGCYSTVGRSGYNKQEISIGYGCEDHGTVLHEILHAMGFWHEQSRPDRDSYVKIIWKNVIRSMKFNFEKHTKSVVDSLNKKYDYASIMHYGPQDFAKQDGLFTMKSVMTLQKGVTFGDKSKLSPLDEEQARLLYNCKGKKTSQTTPAPPVPPTQTSPLPPTQPPPLPPTQPPPLPAGSGSGDGSQ